MGPSPATTEPSSTSPRASSRRSRNKLRLARGSPGWVSAGGAVSVSPEAIQGRPRQGYILRIARGLILRVARGRLVRGPSPPASADPPNNSSCLINASTTPAISAGRWLNATGWPTRPEVASAPYRPGQATVSYHCVLPLCPRPAPYRLGKGTTGITDHCVQTLYP